MFKTFLGLKFKKLRTSLGFKNFRRSYKKERVIIKRDRRNQILPKILLSIEFQLHSIIEFELIDLVRLIRLSISFD